MRKNRYKYSNEMLQKLKSFKEVNEDNIKDIRVFAEGLLIYMKAETILGRSLRVERTDRKSE